MVNQGDIVIVDFDPSLGSEQKGKRPGVVVSNDIYHKKTNGFVIVVPITSDLAVKYPLHVELDSRTKTYGQIMCEQVKTMDTNARNIKTVEKLPIDLLDKTLKIIRLLF
ncbi:MAG: type II toxin-antitoxin system PemK/MazF family toxin [Candidatus Izemoplasmatales bacterium]|nr:type II toxin-antitoxin system PemK/MazF family toxin [Candidatus Izemoplasmatales bacterium]